MSAKKMGSLVIAFAVGLTFFSGNLTAEPEKKVLTTVGENQKKEEAEKAKQNYQFSRPAVFEGQGSNTTLPQKQEVALDYKILVGDRLNVKIYPEDQYVKGGIMQVSSEGNITLPLVGKVKVVDKTLVEAGQDLAKIIDADYLVNAEVVIEMVESIMKSSERKRKVIALGQVRRPGSYELPPEKEKITLLELVSLAGGFTEIANVKKIKVIYRKNGQKQTENINGESVMSGAAPDVELGDGDVVNVSESVF